MKSNFQIVVFLLALGAALYAFSPQGGLLRKDSQQVDTEQAKILEITIKERTLADPLQADLRVRVGERAVLSVTTDEDGRINLRSQEQETFNPVFSGTINSITIPTTRPGSFRIEFYPGVRPNVEGEGFLIGSIVVEG